MFLKDHHRRFPFQLPQEAGHTIFRRDTQQQMHMVGHPMPFQDLYPFPFAQVLDILLYIRAQLLVDDLPPILRTEHDVILAHPL